MKLKMILLFILISMLFVIGCYNERYYFDQNEQTKDPIDCNKTDGGDFFKRGCLVSRSNKSSDDFQLFTSCDFCKNNLLYEQFCDANSKFYKNEIIVDCKKYNSICDFGRCVPNEINDEITQRAIFEKNPDICFENEPSYHPKFGYNNFSAASCLSDYAFYYKDFKICEKIELYTSLIRDNCVLDVLIHSNQKVDCDSLDIDYSKHGSHFVEKCNFLFFPYYELGICDELFYNYSYYYNKCLFLLAIENNDISFCEKVNNKKRCVYWTEIYGENLFEDINYFVLNNIPISG